MTDQFNVIQHDLVSKSVDDTDMVAMIAAICAIESTNPGTLSMVFRLMALAGSDWKLVCNASDPQKSLDAQYELDQWLDEFAATADETVYQHLIKGGKLR